MQARYTRLFTDENGQSRFEDAEIGLASGFAVPPAEPLFTAPFFPAEGTFWIGAPTTWRGDAAHPAPRRMIFVTVRGEYRVTASRNEVRHFPTGSVLLIEDTTGDGHSTEIIGGEEVIVLAIGLTTAP